MYGDTVGDVVESAVGLYLCAYIMWTCSREFEELLAVVFLQYTDTIIYGTAAPVMSPTPHDQNRCTGIRTILIWSLSSTDNAYACSISSYR